MDVLEQWGREWFITFEPTKSQCLTLTRRRADWEIPPIIFGGSEVPEVDGIKLLGVLIDQAAHVRATIARDVAQGAPTDRLLAARVSVPRCQV